MHDDDLKAADRLRRQTAEDEVRDRLLVMRALLDPRVADAPPADADVPRRSMEQHRRDYVQARQALDRFALALPTDVPPTAEQAQRLEELIDDMHIKAADCPSSIHR